MTDQEISALTTMLSRTCDELRTSLGNLGAVALTVRALVGLLDERDQLSAAEVRDRALELADAADTPMPDVRATVERMLPDDMTGVAGCLQ